MDKEIIRKSCKWIDNNFNATSDNLPLDLLETWYIDDIAKALSGDPAYEEKMSIFAYALLKSKMKQTGSKDVKIEATDYNSAFPVWIFKLVTLLKQREGEIKIISPFRLFNFDKSELETLKVERIAEKVN